MELEWMEETMNGLDAPIGIYSTEAKEVEQASPLAVTLATASIGAVAAELGHPLIAAWLGALLLYWLFLRAAAGASRSPASDEDGLH